MKLLKPILLLIFLALFLRTLNLGQLQLGVDEAATISALESKDWGYFIYQHPSLDFNPPLYFILAKLAYSIFPSLIALRFLSAIISLISIILFYILVKKFASAELAALTVLLLTFNPFQIFFSQHLRTYVLFGLFFVLILAELDKTIRKQKCNFIKIIFLNILLLYTHYYAFFVIAAELLALWFVARVNAKRLLLIFALTSLSFLPWAGIILSHYGLVNPGNFPFKIPSIENAAYVFYKMAAAVNISTILSYNYLLFIAPAIVLLLFLYGFVISLSNKNLVTIAIMSFFPIIAAFLASIVLQKPFFYFRYFYFSIFGFVLFVATALKSIKHAEFRQFLLYLIIFCWFTFTLYYYSISAFEGWDKFIGL